MSRWTEEQQQAIDIQGKSLLVSAAAGSGKTAVLVERIIQQICREESPLSLDRMLIVTFTSAAASEMKERIGAALQEKLWENPTSEHLYLQSLLLKDAAITTLHSFCLDFVRKNFFSMGMDPEMKIADSTERILILNEALEKVLEAHYSAEENQDFIAFVDRYGGNDDEKLREMLLQIFRMAESMPMPEQWIRSLGSESETDWFAMAEPEIHQKLSLARKNLVEAIRLAESDAGLQVYMDQLESEYNRISELLQVSIREQWDAVGEVLNTGIFQNLPRTKKDTFDENVKEMVVSRRNDAKDIIKKLREDYFNRSKEKMKNELAFQKTDCAVLAELSLELLWEFADRKAEKNLMDFSDMEHFCYALLYDVNEEGAQTLTELAIETRLLYDQVMVDEYQDINNLQEAILQAVSTEDNLFMVGDLKQSIYGFRMANPQLFYQKYLDYENSDDYHQRIDLNRNFRCREGVIHGVNDLFVQLLDGKHGDLLYDEKAALAYGADYPEYGGEHNLPSEKIQLMLLHTGDDTAAIEDSTDETAEQSHSEALNEEDATVAEKEAKMVAEKLLELMQNAIPVFDKNTRQYRGMNWRDCVILLRSPKTTGRVYAEVLNNIGIPAALDAGDGYFGAWEIQVMIAILQIVDNPIQDIPLLTVMKAPFFDFSEDELLLLRKMRRGEAFYFCLTQLSETTDFEGMEEDYALLYRKTTDFLQTLHRWRAYSRQMRLSDFIWKVITETGFYDYAGALRDGTQRQANLRALYERARSYEKTSFHGVFAFLQFLQQLQERNEDLEPARVLGDSENVVRIMSIHKSKGLEFPMVFVGGMNRQFHLRDAYEGFILDDRLGVALPYVDSDLGVRYNTIAQKVLRDKKIRQLQQEEKRVLYVAMTRAREYLWLVGCYNDLEKQSEKDISAGKSYMDWVLSAHKNSDLWEICVVDKDAVLVHSEKSVSENPLRRAALAGTPAASEGVWREQIGEQLGWQYPSPHYHYVKGLYSVSELKKQKSVWHKDADSGKTDFHFDIRPEAVQKKEQLTGAEKGTLIHEILRHVDPDAVITEEYVHGLVAEMVVRRILTPEQALHADAATVVAFYESELGQRFRNADLALRYRELPFMMQIDSNEVDDTLPENHTPVLVQGIIDCLWKEADGWIIVDYKSDRLNRENASEILHERYQKQLELYCRAVETIWNEPVKEAWFYLLSQNRAIPLEYRTTALE